MKKFILSCSIGFILVFALDFTLGHGVTYFYYNQSAGPQYMTTYAMDKSKEELLIFGSSRAKHHYNTKVLEDELELSIFNTGSDGNFIFYQTALLKAILNRHTPKFIIYDFYGSFGYEQNDYDRLSALLPYYNNHPEIREIVNMRSPFELIKNISHIYPYNSTPGKIVMGNITSKSSKTAHHNNKGYEPVNKKFHNLAEIPYREPYDFDENKVKVFREFLQLCKNRNIPVLVTISPVSYNYPNDFSFEMCKDICEQEGISVYDFSNKTAFPKDLSLFADEIHLNEQGSTVFSKLIVELVKTKFNYKK
ncbi:hypothetical protein [Maribacter sp. Asnod1-A12]|uniref:hypothetical protein n=1 Tax=Maribacter sp. Asnod1-A12 TaxID=3160576 RepID=UPI003868CDC5